MLFKIWNTDHFADEPDRIGVIAAESLDNAIHKLKVWHVESLEGTDYYYTEDGVIDEVIGFTTVTFEMMDADGDVGQDCYTLVPHEGPLMFLSEDWRQVFS